MPVRFARTRKILGGIAAAIVTARDLGSRQSISTSLSRIAEWPLQQSASLGSSVRTRGIEREIRARLPWAVRKYIKAGTGCMTLRMREDDAEEFEAASNKTAKILETIEVLPVLPREAEDILAIS
ncbi:hypothetical protein [Mesorhizobium sp. M7A.F.Ca.US.008.03.1.1]|uniref:hypothetical protein n=1 Tax=Mesorhizobium sp. M7A.F.Ca.US.008.03.1.1 TaxID=2496742 RepID=UPI001FDFA4EE|nr:hypothetical protein [Mesorhizobium sp. M7A.F.Ca.US.008.03.1.1]